MQVHLRPVKGLNTYTVRQEAMASINLKKLLSRNNTSILVEKMVAAIQSRITLSDPDDSAVLGEQASDLDVRIPIVVENETIGWAAGGRGARQIAELLSYIAQRELEIKSMGRETLEKYKEITLLYNFAEKISARHTPEQIAEYAMGELAKIVKADTVYVALVDEQTCGLNLLGSSGIMDIPTVAARSEHGIVCDILKKGNAEIVNDVPSDSRFAPGDNAVSSMVCAPLKAQDKVIGVVVACSSTPLSYSSGDLKLFTAIASQSAIAIENANYITELVKVTAIRERFESELKVAQNIQMSMIPRNFPAFPDRPEFSIHAFMKPAQQVGGDLYDFFMLDEHHLFFTIGDVSGKGVPAALTMANFVTLIKVLAAEEHQPDNLLLRLNREFSRINDYMMFVTIFCGVLDTRTGEVEYANGGHCHPLVIGPGKKLTQLTGADGPAVGFDEESVFIRNKVTLQHGDTVIAYTDGVTEANDRDSKLFSTSRLAGDVEGKGGEGIEEITGGIYSNVQAFSEGMPQSDDITILVIRYN